jgi:hypothetical protein
MFAAPRSLASLRLAPRGSPLQGAAEAESFGLLGGLRWSVSGALLGAANRLVTWECEREFTARETSTRALLPAPTIADFCSPKK